MKIRLLYILLFLLPFELFCQKNTFQFEHFSVEDGLPGNIVNDIIKDKDGFLWLATWNGLCRYDGYEFQLLGTDIPAKGKLSNHSVTSITEATNGDILIGTQVGFNVYSKEKNEILSFLHDANDSSSLSNNDIWDVFVDSKNRIWISTRGGGLNLYNPKNNTFTQVLHKLIDTDEINICYEIAEDKNGTLWIGGNKNLKYNHDEQKLEYFDNTYIFDSFRILMSVFYAPVNDKIYAGCWGFGAMELDTDSNTWKILSSYDQATYYLNNNIPRVFAEWNGKILIGTNGGGLNVYEPNKGVVESYVKNKQQNSISDNTVLCIFVDEQQIWVGTDGGGLNKINLNRSPIKNIVPSTYNSGTDNSVHSIYKAANNDIYMGTKSSGLVKFTRDNTLINLKVLENDPVYKILPYKSGNKSLKLIGSKIEKLSIYNEADKSLIDVNREQTFSTYEILPAGNNKIWIATYGGLSLVNLDNNESELIKCITNTSKTPFTIASCLLDEDSVLWVGTHNAGIVVFDKKDRVLKKIEKSSKPGKRLNTDDVNVLFKDSSGEIWIGTNGHGLNIYNYETDSVRFVTKDQGLAGNIVQAIEEDEHKNLWISTNTGLSKLNTLTGIIQNYNKLDGLADNYFHTNASFQDADGILYFGGVNGVSYFHPDSFRTNKLPPKIVITEFFLNEEKVRSNQVIHKRTILKQPVYRTKNIELQYNENNFAFRFSALDYSVPGKNKYRYQLVGYDSKPVLANTERRKATYSNMPHGEYVFKVWGTNNDGLESKTPAEISIIIHPPFWKTIWVRLSAILFIMNLVWWAYRFRIRTLKRRQKDLEEEVKERTAKIETQKEKLKLQADNLIKVNDLLKERQKEIEKQAASLQQLNATKDKFFSIIAHDLKNPFQGIKGFSQLLIERDESIEKDSRINFLSMMKNSSESAENLLENLLDWARSQTGKMDVNTEVINIYIIAKEIKLLLDVLANKKKIEISVSMDEELYALADRNMITTALRNITNNAIKFTPENGKINISGWHASNHIIIDITDNGIGMSENIVNKLFRIDTQHITEGTEGEKGTGLGLIICQDFILKNHGEITVKSKEKKGTTFTIKLPSADDPAISLAIRKYNFKPGQKEEVKETRQIKPSVNPPEDCNKPVLLIADDHDYILNVLKENFKDSYHVYTAESGAKALDLSKQIIPDLIISDVVMPEPDGVELCNLLKTEIKTCHIPVILLTSQAAVEDRIKGFQTGADDYITKPFDVTVLKARANNLIENRKTLRKAFSDYPEKDNKITSENPLDKKFIEKLNNCIEDRISDSDFTVNDLAQNVALSTTHLYRKIVALTGENPNEYIRRYRLKRAARLIKSKEYSISEVLYQVGFNTPSYFSKEFKKYFGKSPSEYAKKNKSQ